MVSNQFLYQLLNLLVIVVKTAAFLSGKYYILNGLNLCGRAGKTYLFGISLYESRAPFRDGQIGTFFNQSLYFRAF